MSFNSAGMLKISNLYETIYSHIMNDEMPSDFLNQICDDPLFKKPPFDMLYNLKMTEQSPVHHPEGNVWNHTMLVLDEAAQLKHKSQNPEAFMWAVLLHDIGKPPTTRNRKGKITSYDHDRVGAEMSVKFLLHFTDDHSFVRKVSELIRYHMHILYIDKDLPFADIKGMLKNTNVTDVALLGFCDRCGRTNCDRYKEEGTIKRFFKKIGFGNLAIAPPLHNIHTSERNRPLEP